MVIWVSFSIYFVHFLSTGDNYFAIH